MEELYKELNKKFKSIMKNNQIHLCKNDGLLKEVIEATKFLDNDASNSERIYCIKNYIYEIPLCKNCNKPLKFNRKSNSYRQYCNSKCANSCKSKLDKFKQTCIEKYGTDNPMKNEDIKLNSKSDHIKNYQNMVKRIKEIYNVDHIMELKETRDKIKETCLKKYGTENPMQNQDIKNKLSKHNLVKSYDKIIHRDNFLETVTPLFNSDNYKGRFGNNLYRCNKCGLEFEDWIDSTYKFKPRCPVCYPKNSSLFEREISDYIKSILGNKTLLLNDRKVLKGLELDLYIPEIKLGIECNGLYWHSDLNDVDRLYHYNKYKLCNENDIALIQIFEDEWSDKKDIVKNLIKSFIEDNEVNYNDLIIKKINKTTKSNFLSRNHILGDCKSEINLGLYNKNKLISVMTLNKLNNSFYQIKRYIDINSNISDLCFNKFISYIKENILDEDDCIAIRDDLRFSYNDFYINNGFEFKWISEPTYYYINRKANKRFSKSLIENKHLENSYYKIWNCGYKVYYYKHK